MSETPTTAYRALSERTSISLKPATLLGLIGAAITLTFGAAVWATSMATSQANLERWARAFDHRLDRLETAIGVKVTHAPRDVDADPVIP